MIFFIIIIIIRVYHYHLHDHLLTSNKKVVMISYLNKEMLPTKHELHEFEQAYLQLLRFYSSHLSIPTSIPLGDNYALYVVS